MAKQWSSILGQIYQIISATKINSDDQDSGLGSAETETGIELNCSSGLNIVNFGIGKRQSLLRP